MNLKTLAAIYLFCITSVIQAQDDGFLDIRPKRGIGFWEANWPWAAPAIAVVIVLIAIALYFITKRKPEKQLTAYQLAMKEIARASLMKQNDDDKAFSIAVSKALRNYIEAVFRIRAPEQTTEEFLLLAEKDHRISDEAVGTLGDFLQLCDLAKFARQAFGIEERDKLLATAKEFVEQAQKQRREQIQSGGGVAS